MVVESDDRIFETNSASLPLRKCHVILDVWKVSQLIDGR